MLNQKADTGNTATVNPTDAPASKNYSSEHHKMMANHLDSAAKLHKEAAGHVDSGNLDKGNQSGGDAEVHYTKAGEIDQRYTAARDHDTAAHHYAQVASHRKDAASHRQMGNHSKANESNAKATEHLTKAGEIDHRYKESNDQAISAGHYDQASIHRKETATHTRNGDDSKASQSHANANEHLTKAGEIDRRYTVGNNTNGSSNASQNDKHPRGDDGHYVAKN
ncbi:MAG: hypothetical protein QE285_03000 [Aquabacterium sp.]|nr:hypothetical protein [Aquabacterium sp.]